MTMRSYNLLVANILVLYHYTPANEVWGYIGITLSICLSIRLSVQSKLNLGYNFWTKRDRAFMLHMCVPCGKIFPSVPKIWTSWPWTWLLTYVWKKHNLRHNFLTIRDGAFILHVCIPCGKTFLLLPNILTLWPWHWLLTYFWKKNLTLTFTFEPE